MTDRNVEAICELHRQRAEHGLQKYGVSTERDDFTLLEWLQHLQDELMDGAVYTQKLKALLAGGHLKGVIRALNEAAERVSEAKAATHHSFQKTHVALREAGEAIGRALQLAERPVE